MGGSNPSKSKKITFSPKRPNQLWSPARLLYTGYRGSFPGWVKLTTLIHPGPRPIMNGALHLLPLYAFMTCTETVTLNGRHVCVRLGVCVWVFLVCKHLLLNAPISNSRTRQLNMKCACNENTSTKIVAIPYLIKITFTYRHPVNHCNNCNRGKEKNL